MRRTEAHRDRGGALGPRRTLAAFLLSAALCLPAPLPAQQADDTPADRVLALTAEGMGQLLHGNINLARPSLEQARELALDESLPVGVRAFPDLGFAQMAYLEGDWPAVARHAERFEDVLLQVGFGDHPYRNEAVILRGVAAQELGDSATALALLRGAVETAATLPDDEPAEELARFYLGLAATLADAPDAAALRAAFLDFWGDRGWVSRAQSHMLRYPGLALDLPLPGSWADRDLSEDEVLDLADAGLDLAEAGYRTAGYRLLERANDVTYNGDYPLLTDHYPNLAFARYHYILENWSELQRFAASVASALDREESENHPYRIEATIFQGVALYENGRTGEAEVLLRGAMTDSAGIEEMADLHELAHYYLSRAATANDTPDASQLRESFMAGFTGENLVTNGQALFLFYLSLNAAIRADEDPVALVEQSTQLIELADTVEGIDPVYRSFYRGNHGRLLYEARLYDEARAFFEERRDFLAGRDLFGSDYAVNAVRLGNALARTEGVDPARDAMLDDLALLREHGQSEDWAVADVLGQIAYTYRWQNDEATAQDYLRQAYAELRRSRRVTDDRVKFYAALIDPEDPGMAGFPLAAELGRVDETAYELKSSGEDTIRMFLEGNYAGLERLLDAYAREGKDQSPEYLVNLATYKAMVGDYEESQEALAEARRKARTSLGSAIAANAPVFDLVELIAKVWGTVHLADKAEGAIARLAAREDTLSPGQLSLYLAFRALSKYQSGHEAGLRADIQRWMEAQPDERAAPPDVLEQWAYALMCEMIYVQFGAEEGDLWMDRMLGWIAMARGGELSLVRDTMELTRTFSSPTLFTSDLATSQMSGLASAILDQIPADHMLGAATQFNVANAFWNRNMFDEALYWMQRATDTWRANPYHRRDTLSFLVSRQASLMMQNGQADVAATLAREAYDMVDIHEARGDLIAGVIMTYAYAVRMRNSNAEMGGAILKRHIEDEAFMRRIPPRDTAQLHQSYADMLANYAPLDEVLHQLDLAEAALPDDNLDWRPDLSQIAFTRAIAIYWSEDHVNAWREIQRANDIKAAWRRDTIGDGDGEDVSAVDVQNRAAWEALIGWDYAQTLPPDTR